MGSHLRLPVKRAPAAWPAVAPSAGCAFPRAAVRVRRRQAARVRTHPIRLRPYLVFDRKRMPTVSPESTGSAEKRALR